MQCWQSLIDDKYLDNINFIDGKKIVFLMYRFCKNWLGHAY